MSDPAEQIKAAFDGMTSTIKGLADTFAENDYLDLVLREWLTSKGIVTSVSVRHYARFLDGDNRRFIEFKMKEHSIAQGENPDKLWYAPVADLKKWKDAQNGVSTRPIIQINKEGK